MKANSDVSGEQSPQASTFASWLSSYREPVSLSRNDERVRVGRMLFPPPTTTSWNRTRLAMKSFGFFVFNPSRIGVFLMWLQILFVSIIRKGKISEIAMLSFLASVPRQPRPLHWIYQWSNTFLLYYNMQTTRFFGQFAFLGKTRWWLMRAYDRCIERVLLKPFLTIAKIQILNAISPWYFSLFRTAMEFRKLVLQTKMITFVVVTRMFFQSRMTLREYLIILVDQVGLLEGKVHGPCYCLFQSVLMLAEAMAPRFKAMKYMEKFLKTRDLSDVPPEYIVPGEFASTSSFDPTKESKEFDEMMKNPPNPIHLDQRYVHAFRAHEEMTRALPHISPPTRIFEPGTEHTVQLRMGSLTKEGYTDDPKFMDDSEYVHAEQQSLLDFLLSSQERSPVLRRLSEMVKEKFHVDVSLEEYSMPIAFCMVAFVVIVSGVFGTIVTPNFIENTIKRQGQVLRASTTIYDSCMSMAQPLAEFFSHVLEMGPILPSGASEVAAHAELLKINSGLAKDLVKMKEGIEDFISIHGGAESYLKKMQEQLLTASKKAKELKSSVLLNNILGTAQTISVMLARFTTGDMIRQEPTVIYLYGPAGSGKSSMVHDIILQLRAHHKRHLTVWHMPAASEYFDGYNQADIMVWDDMLQSSDTFGKQASTFINLVSSSAYLPAMAHLEDKGISFTSKYIIVTTNVPGLFAESPVSCPDAFNRRRHIMVKVSEMSFGKRMEEIFQIHYATDPTKIKTHILQEPVGKRIVMSKAIEHAYEYQETKRQNFVQRLKELTTQEHAQAQYDLVPKFEKFWLPLSYCQNLALGEIYTAYGYNTVVETHEQCEILRSIGVEVAPATDFSGKIVEFEIFCDLVQSKVTRTLKKIEPREWLAWRIGRRTCVPAKYLTIEGPVTEEKPLRFFAKNEIFILRQYGQPDRQAFFYVPPKTVFLGLRVENLDSFEHGVYTQYRNFCGLPCVLNEDDPQLDALFNMDVPQRNTVEIAKTIVKKRSRFTPAVVFAAMFVALIGSGVVTAVIVTFLKRAFGREVVPENEQKIKQNHDKPTKDVYGGGIYKSAAVIEEELSRKLPNQRVDYERRQRKLQSKPPRKDDWIDSSGDRVSAGREPILERPSGGEPIEERRHRVQHKPPVDDQRIDSSGDRVVIGHKSVLEEEKIHFADEFEQLERSSRRKRDEVSLPRSLNSDDGSVSHRGREMIEEGSFEACIDQNTLDIAEKIGCRSMVRVVGENDYGTMTVQGIMVYGRIGVTVGHAFSDMKFWNVILNDGSVYPIIRHQAVQHRDVAIFEVSEKCHSFVDIRSHFRPKGVYEVPRFASVLACLRRVRENCVTFWMYTGSMEANIGVRIDDGVYAGSAVQIKKLNGYETSTSLTRKGDCGSPYYILDANTKEKILGIHFASTKETAYFAPVYSDDFKLIESEVLAEKEGGDYLFGIAQAPREIEEKWEQRFPGCTVEGILVTENGQRNYIHSPNKTHFHRSPLSCDLLPDEYEPAVMNQFDTRLAEKKSVLFDGVKKWMSPRETSIDQDLLALVVESVKVKLLHACNGSVFRVLSHREAITGTHDIPYSTSINLDTSGGYLFPSRKYGGKRDYLFFNPIEGCLDFVAEKKQALFTRLSKLIQKLKRGEPCPFVFQATIKDEVLKKHKIPTGASRIFAAAPLDLVILQRKYFGAAYWALMQARKKIPAKVGINPYSMEWTDLRNYMLQVSDTGFCCDYKNFDGTIPREFLIATGEIYEALYKEYDSNWSEADAVLRKTLVDSYAGPTLGLVDSALIAEQGNPSGHVGTSCDNCIVNWLAYEYCFAKMCAEKGKSLPFDEHVRLAVYGDDNIVTFSLQAQKIVSYERLKYWMQTLGLEITPADKEAETAVWTKLDEMSFLKRTFATDGRGRYFGRLDKVSMGKPLHWCKGPAHHYFEHPTDVHISVKDLANVSESLLMEAAMHEKSFYISLLKHLSAKSRELGFSLRVRSYEAQQNVMFNYDSVAAQESFLRVYGRRRIE